MNNLDDREFWDQLALKMKDYSDEEIVSVLRSHRLYEPQAVRIAVEEGIRRGIIRSEDDIYDGNFQSEKPGFRLFPFPEKETAMIRIIRSLTRALLIAGLIPVVFGVLKFQVFRYAEGSAMIVAGLAWISCTWMIYTRKDSRYWNPLPVIALLSMLYVGRMLILLKGLRAMDYVIPGILFFIIFYSLLYLRTLLRNLPHRRKQ